MKHLPVIRGEGELHLVAKALLQRRRERGQYIGGFDAPDALQAVTDEAFLPRQLGRVGQVLPCAAATVAEVRAERVALVCGVSDNGKAFSLCEAFAHSREADMKLLARQTAVDEDDAPFMAADGLAARREGIDRDVERHAVCECFHDTISVLRLKARLLVPSVTKRVLTFPAIEATSCPSEHIRQAQPRSRAMISELIENAMHSSPQGFVGVSLIGIYFCVIVATAFYRISKGDHLGGHH